MLTSWLIGAAVSGRKVIGPTIPGYSRPSFEATGSSICAMWGRAPLFQFELQFLPSEFCRRECCPFDACTYFPESCFSSGGHIIGEGCVATIVRGSELLV